jgi:hypothetical protein
MTIALIVLILLGPFAVSAALTWAANRSHILAIHLDQFRFSAPMVGRLFDDPDADRDGLRVHHDLDAVRTRFENQPAWPSSGALGERR